MEQIISLDKTNIDKEHICCAISDKKCKDSYELKKDWLKKEFDKGYVFLDRKISELDTTHAVKYNDFSNALLWHSQIQTHLFLPVAFYASLTIERPLHSLQYCGKIHLSYMAQSHYGLTLDAL